MPRTIHSALLAGVLGLAACGGLVPPAPSNTVVTIPASVDATCASDITAQLQAAIDEAAQHKTLRLTPGACYRAEQPLTIEHADGFTLEGSGATIRRTESGPDDGSARTRMHFVVRSSRNVVIEGLTLIGPHPTEGRRYMAPYEAQHAFWLDGDVQGFWLVRRPSARSGATSCISAGVRLRSRPT